MNNSDNSKRFDEWKDTVECNDCVRYWDNSCDGVKKGSKRLCNSFLATRSVIIPLKLKRLERAFKWILGLCVVLSIVSVSTLVLVLRVIFGG